MAFSSILGQVVTMALSGSAGLSYQDGPTLLPQQPQTLASLLGAVEQGYYCLVSGGGVYRQQSPAVNIWGQKDAVTNLCTDLTRKCFAISLEPGPYR